MDLFLLIGTLLAGVAAVGTIFNYSQLSKADRAFEKRMKEEIEKIRNEKNKALLNKSNQTLSAFLTIEPSNIFITPVQGMEIANKIDDVKLRSVVIDLMKNSSINSQINYLTSIVQQSGNTSTVIVKDAN